MDNLAYERRIANLEERINKLDKLDEIKFYDADGNRLVWLYGPEAQDVKAFLIESWQKEIETLKRLERIGEHARTDEADR